MNEPDKTITFDEFRLLIASELKVEERLVVPEASFVEDLYADSIRLVQMMVHLAERGITIPMQEAWSIRTVGDAYRLYSGSRMAGDSQAPRTT